MKKYFPYSKDRKFYIGERARIVFNDVKTVGTLVSLGRKLTDSMPEFELEDGRHVFGYECWWLPLDLAEKIETKVAEK